MRWWQIVLALSSAGLLSTGCIEMDGFLFEGEPATMGEYDFESAYLDGIGASRITSVRIPSGDGKIHVVYISRDETELSTDIRPFPPVTVVYSHGNSANIMYYWYRGAYLEDMGFNVLLYDYRGYGASTGAASEKNVFEDAVAAYNYARQREPNGLIVSYGYSMGGAPAIYLCSSESGVTPVACITESTFAGTQQMIDSSGYHIPSDWLLTTHFANAARAEKITRPFLVMHGTADDVVGFGHSAILWDALAGNNPLNRYIAVNGANHRNLPIPSWRSSSRNLDEFSHPDELPPAYYDDYQQYRQRIVTFITAVLNGR